MLCAQSEWPEHMIQVQSYVAVLLFELVLRLLLLCYYAARSHVGVADPRLERRTLTSTNLQPFNTSSNISVHPSSKSKGNQTVEQDDRAISRPACGRNQITRDYVRDPR